MTDFMMSDYFLQQKVETVLEYYSFKLMETRENQFLDNKSLRLDILQYVSRIHIILNELRKPPNPALPNGETPRSIIFKNKEIILGAMKYYIKNVAQPIDLDINDFQFENVKREKAELESIISWLSRY
jgi:hypothetical protein